jgi:hypothetical protein
VHRWKDLNCCARFACCLVVKPDGRGSRPFTDKTLHSRCQSASTPALSRGETLWSLDRANPGISQQA